ncbi:isoprenylcysteine carboxylmethyltransferase family protein [Mycolicibacterium sp. CH28]|uniref:methyltransferase family protein n=1 Tax=Mycolicibacterium sp. CH28 TaxID=2512237 RepID=UPI0010820ADF|nr:isoprenylcysteine carboxylmethyltransferase family protein [Mycolicibacterium sp. CH28]TGD85737.1 isoprenylcysteine carboxylmethyltransferase family protein [Mycolicibacterium sp. CH28]
MSTVLGFAAFAVLLFWPAGTLGYWQGWVFLSLFTVASLVSTGILSRIDPAAFERRTHAGPAAETRTVQKVVIVGTVVACGALLAVSALDWRMGWSQLPAWVSVLGDVLVVVGLGMAMLVVYQNRYAAANITVEENQPLVSTGLYGVVRHPMYLGTLILMIGIPLALGSYWALLIVVPGCALLVVRILDEEKLLSEELDGYRRYMQTVRYRLVPLAW